jgi:hypothetical protein
MDAVVSGTDRLIAQDLLGDPAKPGVTVFGGEFTQLKPLQRFIKWLISVQC